MQYFYNRPQITVWPGFGFFLSTFLLPQPYPGTHTHTHTTKIHNNPIRWCTPSTLSWGDNLFHIIPWHCRYFGETKTLKYLWQVQQKTNSQKDWVSVLTHVLVDWVPWGQSTSMSHTTLTYKLGEYHGLVTKIKRHGVERYECSVNYNVQNRHYI